METAIGIGNLLGGFALGLVTARIAKGRLIIAAYTAFGVLVFFVGFIPPLPIMLALMFGIGIANMALRHPQPDAVPGADAARADGAAWSASGSRSCSA